MSGAPDNSSRSHFPDDAAVLTRSSGEEPAAAIQQASRRWRGGRREDSARTRQNFDFHTGENSQGSSAPPFERMETREFDAWDGAFDAQTFKSRTKTSNAVAPSSSRRQCGVNERHQPYWHFV